METTKAMWLLSVMGLANTGVKFIYGAIMVIFPRVNATRFVSVSLLVAGLSLITTGFRPHDPFWAQMIWSIFFAQGVGKLVLKNLVADDQ